MTAYRQFRYSPVVGKLGCNAELYVGYIQQLQSMTRDNAGEATGLDISDLRVRNIVRLYLGRYTPRWFSSSVYKTCMFFKKLFRRM